MARGTRPKALGTRPGRAMFAAGARRSEPGARSPALGALELTRFFDLSSRAIQARARREVSRATDPGPVAGLTTKGGRCWQAKKRPARITRRAKGCERGATSRCD